MNIKCVINKMYYYYNYYYYYIVRCIAPLDETSLVLLDQTVNYLLHTRSKNFSIDFYTSHGISEIGL